MKRRKVRAIKAAAKARRIANPGHSSRYARKVIWLHRNGKWGWEISEPKPWK